MPELSWPDVAIAWVLMAAHALWCLRWDRKLALDWLWASVRSLVQLGALGFVLAFLFRMDHWGWNSPALGFMLFISASTVVTRTQVRVPGLLRDCLLSLAIACAVGLLPVVLLFHSAPELRNTAALIPLVGIMLGNSLSGLSLGVARWLGDLKDRQSEVEFWIALGASPLVASAPLRGAALRVALTTVINSMAVAGVVSIPGMMTGQLLAGGDPGTAVRYQLMVLFLIAAVVFLASYLCLALTSRRIFDAWGAYRMQWGGAP